MKNISTFCITILCLVCSLYLSAQTGTLYTIPVVVHVIHNNGPENITDSLIHDALAEVNRNFNAQNASLTGVASPFVSIIGNMQIYFCLAHTDPEGQPTTGIDRAMSLLTYYGDSDAVKQNQWPPDRYMNLWVVDSLRSFGWLPYFPGRSTIPLQAVSDSTKDGVVAAYYVFLAGQRGLLTNLMAQYFDLSNTWGNTNNPGVACGDDNINDTPVTQGQQLTCDTSMSVCITGTIENVQNFMNFSSCTCMFTQGQVDRVHNTLNSSVAHRNNLSSPANLAITCAAPTDVSSIDIDNITVSPNPFTTEIDILRPAHVEQKIVLYDMVGRKVIDEEHSRSGKLLLSEIAPGTYTLSIMDGAIERSFHVTKVQ